MSPHNNQPGFAKRPILCYVTDRWTLPEVCAGNSLSTLAEKINEVAAAGIDWIQIREKDLSAKALSSLTRDALRAAQGRLEPLDVSNGASNLQPTRIILNDRLDIAIAGRAHGVHLGEASLPAPEAKRLIQSAQQLGSLPEDFLLGVSCHSLDAAKEAARAGADYILFGPVFATPSKTQYGAPQGRERLAEVCRAVSTPVLAIGGVTADNAADCLRAGASGLAAIRLFQHSDPAPVAQALRQSWKE